MSSRGGHRAREGRDDRDRGRHDYDRRDNRGGGSYRGRDRDRERRRSRSRSPRRDHSRRGGPPDRRDHDDRRGGRDDRRRDHDRDDRRDGPRRDDRDRDRDREREKDGKDTRERDRAPRERSLVPPPRAGPSGSTAAEPAKPKVDLDPDTGSPDPGMEEGEAMEAENDDDAAMMALMGMSGFGTTKGKHVEGNQEGGVNVKKIRTWRQYMNRRGGFNRPLDKIK